MDPITSVLFLVAAIAGGLITIGTAIRYAWKGLRILFKVVDQVEFIFHEVKPNSGSSMKDQMNRFDDGLVTVKDGLADVKVQVEEGLTAVRQLFDEHLAQHLSDRALASEEHQEVMDVTSPSIKRTPTQ
jgi:hypothetical protein